MSRPKTENLFSNYVRVRNPDQKRLAELTVKAMGDRSLNKFASDCGVYPSTLSRLIKSQVKGPCSEKLIDVIGKNAAEGSGVNLDMLLDAYGLEPYEILTAKKEKYSDDMPLSPNLVQRSLKGLSDKFDTLARKIIIAQLVDMGYNVKEKTIEESSDEKKYFKFALSTDALNDQGIDEWYFDSIYGSHSLSSDYFKNLYVYLYSNCFSNQNKACSIIVSNEDSLNDVLKITEKDIVRDYISVIWIDTDKYEVIKECILRYTGRAEYKSIFSS